MVAVALELNGLAFLLTILFSTGFLLPAAAAQPTSLPPIAYYSASILLLLPASTSAQTIAGKSDGTQCVCPAPPPAPPFPSPPAEEEEAAEEEADAGGDDGGGGESSSNERCERENKDVQKMFISGAAGGFLALALANRANKRDGSTWVRMSEAEAQTYDEPCLPEIKLPPIVQFLPPGPPYPGKQMPPQIIYEKDPKPPMNDKNIQSKPDSIVSVAQTDQHGKPHMVSRSTEMPVESSHHAGVQTKGIPHTDAFAQASVGKKIGTTQMATADELEKERMVMAATQEEGRAFLDFAIGDGNVNDNSSTAHGGWVGGGSGGGSGGGIPALMLTKETQTVKQMVYEASTQSDNLYMEPMGTMTAAPSAPLSQGSQTPGWMTRRPAGA